jgi:hypothetical protein
MIDHEAVALTLLCIRAEADSDVHAREAMARYFVSQVGEEGTGDDQLSLGGWQEEEQGWDWPEWLASDNRPLDEPWQGAGNRWFVKKMVKNQKGEDVVRVVPAPNPDKAKAAPKEKAPAKPQDKAAPTKRSASVPKTKVSVEETWAKVQDALKGGGSAEDAVQALAGLGLADIRKLRDQHKGEKGGRSKSEVAQRLIAVVKSRMDGQQPAKAKDAPAPAPKPEPKPTPALEVKPEVTTDAIRQAWDKLPGAKDNLVSLADLQDALGVDTPTLHRLVNDLRRKGVLTAQNLENRTGTQSEKDRLKAAGIPDGQNTIGYVAMMDAGQEQTPAPARQPQPKREPLHARVVRDHPPETKPKLSDEEVAQVKLYASKNGSAEDVNMGLRGKYKIGTEARAAINAISSAIRKTTPMKEPIACERYMYGDSKLIEDFATPMREAMKTGGMVQLPGFTSTTTGISNSTSKKIYDANPIKLKIAVRQGLSVRDYSEAPHEEEILMDHNSRFRVISMKPRKIEDSIYKPISSSTDGWEIELEQVLPGEE